MNARAENRRAAKGAVLLVGGAVMFALVFFGVVQNMLGGAKDTVRANFLSVGGLNLGEPVRLEGLTVGKVTSMTRHGARGDVTVEMEVAGDSGRLFTDARASIRWRTVLGGAYVVDLDRGTPGMPELGSRVIASNRTTNQVELDEITASLRAGQRRGLRRIFHELPKAFGDPAEPGRLFASLADAARPVAEGVDTLRGQRRHEDLRNLIINTGRTTSALDAPPRLQGLVRDLALTTGATASRAGDLRATLEIGGSILPRTRATVRDLEHTLDLANPLLADLRAPAAAVAPALRALRPVLTGADRLLTDRAKPLLASLRPTARSLAAAARAGVPLLAELTPSLRRIDRSILPDLAQRSPESRRTTYEILGPAVAGLQGAAAHYDDESQYVRLLGSGSAHALDALPCSAYFLDPNSPALVQCKALGDALSTLFGNPPARRGARR